MSERLTCTACGAEVEIGAPSPGKTAQCPACGEELYRKARAVGADPAVSKGRESYNIASDLVTGVNVRPKDNLHQGISILVAMVLGCGVGYLVAGDIGVALGAIGGLVVGLIGSGIFIMIYRAVRHSKGKHD